MATFALIAEGSTDQVVLEQIITQVCGETFEGDIEVNYLQPLRDATDAAERSFGGWELTLEYCREHFNDALETNDFVVVQIDTDAGDHQNFGVPLTQGGVDRGYLEIISDAKALLQRNIGNDLLQIADGRIIFAISVHSIESWLLLCLFDRDEPKASFARLKKHLGQANQPKLVKEVRYYRAITKKIRRKRFIELVQTKTSLAVFLNDLILVCPA